MESNASTCNPSISSRVSKLRTSSVPNIPKVDETTITDAPFEDVKLDEDEHASRKTILSRFGFGTRTPLPKKREGEELQSIKVEK